MQGVVPDVSVEQEVHINRARPLSSRSTRNLVRQSEFSSVRNMSKSQQPNTAKVRFRFISQPSVDPVWPGREWGSRGARGLHAVTQKLSFFLPSGSIGFNVWP